MGLAREVMQYCCLVSQAPIMFMPSVVIDCSMHVPLQVLLINSIRIE